MQGRRIYPNENGEILFKEGDYGKHPEMGVWLCWPPGSGLGNLAQHTVTEHDDGTITVSPSILIRSTDDDGSPVVWHGYLERGVWRTV